MATDASAAGPESTARSVRASRVRPRARRPSRTRPHRDLFSGLAHWIPLLVLSTTPLVSQRLGARRARDCRSRSEAGWRFRIRRRSTARDGAHLAHALGSSTHSPAHLAAELDGDEKRVWIGYAICTHDAQPRPRVDSDKIDPALGTRPAFVEQLAPPSVRPPPGPAVARLASPRFRPRRLEP